MKKFRVVTETGKEIMRAESYTACENYWNACNGIYEDENGEQYIYIEEIWNNYPAGGVKLQQKLKNVYFMERWQYERIGRFHFKASDGLFNK